MQGQQLLKNLLEEKVDQYNTSAFIADDPILIPHSFSEVENIEISAFLATTLAWGRRDIIISNTFELIRRMENRPFEFLMNMKEKDLEVFRNFKHRTFNGQDCIYFMSSLRRIYQEKKGLYEIFRKGYETNKSIKDAIVIFRNEFFAIEHPGRSMKHVADPSRGSAAKRINLFLRWMVRKDNAGVDMGLWDGIDPADLYLPLDIHTGNVARQLGILKRKQNDWKAVEEVTALLRQFDPKDPVKYDYALFGLGFYENS